MTLSTDVDLLEAIDVSSTLDLHRSNLLRLQVNELLDEIRLDLDDCKWTVQAHEYLQLVSKIICGVVVKEKKFQEIADKPVSIEISGTENASLSVEQLGCTRYKLGWTKQSGNAQTLPTFDLIVQIPSTSFKSKDFLNYRYFDKQKAVVDDVAKVLEKNSDTVGMIQYVWTRGMNRPPLLQLRPRKKKKAARFQVHLHFGMTSIDWIPRLRLIPNRFNIKDKGMMGQYYNHCLLFDMRHQFQDAHLHELAEHKSCQDALVLIKVWALQRGLWRNHDGWDISSVALLMVYLLRTQKMNSRMTPLQVFAVVLNTWATTNWLGHSEPENQHCRAAKSHSSKGAGMTNFRTVLVLPDHDLKESETAARATLSELYVRQTRESPLSPEDAPTLLGLYSCPEKYQLGPVFLDPTMTYNYLGDVSSNYMKILQCHAKKSLKALRMSRSAFQFLFMKPTRFWEQWDLYLKIPSTCKGNLGWEFGVRHLMSKLEIGLGDRINAMRVLSSGNGSISESEFESDQYASEEICTRKRVTLHSSCSPTGTDFIVLGFSINPETSQRAVDRGPPSDNHSEVQHFMKLWGNKAQLRRFKDGAIVQAVVWNDEPEERFQNSNKWDGGFVEKVANHLIKVHHSSKKVSRCLPNLLGVIDSTLSSNEKRSKHFDPWSAHQDMLKTFDSLSDFLRQKTVTTLSGSLQANSLGLPLPIDAVEPLSPCLRYCELFPPVPHPFLRDADSLEKKVSGAIVSDPIVIQIRFGPSSKWPTDLKAIGAAKTAMLIQLAQSIENMANGDFSVPITVCTTYADIVYKGYCFRVLVRADPEIQMLRRLTNPSPFASALLVELEKTHVLGSRHHSMIHAVHSLHPSAGAVVRIAKRWAASHLLSGHLCPEAIELLVTKVYTGDGFVLEAPATSMAGFLRFLHLFWSHDWVREPLIVDPQGHISDDEYDAIHRAFEESREDGNQNSPPMFFIAPYNKVGNDEEVTGISAVNSIFNNATWEPSVTSPELVVLKRMIELARRSFDFMRACVVDFDEANWPAIFRESRAAFKSYSMLLRVNPDFVIDGPSSSTIGINCKDGSKDSIYFQSMRSRNLGPVILCQKHYRNLRRDSARHLITAWQPVKEVIADLKARFGKYALFFYNEYCPEVICVLWRPSTFTSGSFSVVASEHCRPVEDAWKVDTLVVRNAGDMLREMGQRSKHIVTNIRVFDQRSVIQSPKRRKLSKDSMVEGTYTSFNDSDATNME